MQRHPLPALLAGFLNLVSGHVQAAEQPLESIRSAVSNFLQQESDKNAQAVQIEVGRLDPRLRLAACTTPLSVYLAPGARMPGNTSVGVRCDGASPWALFVPASVRQKFVVVTAAQTLTRGKLLAPADLRVESRYLMSLPTGALEDPAVAVGRVVTRQLATGSLVTAGALREERAVRRGQTVTLSLAAGSLVIRVSGTALKDGALGDRITVRNTTSNRVVEGVIIEAGVVEVGATQPTAQTN